MPRPLANGQTPAEMTHHAAYSLSLSSVAWSARLGRGQGSDAVRAQVQPNSGSRGSQCTACAYTMDCASGDSLSTCLQVKHVVKRCLGIFKLEMPRYELDAERVLCLCTCSNDKQYDSSRLDRALR